MVQQHLKYSITIITRRALVSCKTLRTRGVLHIIVRLIINSMTSFLTNIQLNFFVCGISTIGWTYMHTRGMFIKNRYDHSNVVLWIGFFSVFFFHQLLIIIKAIIVMIWPKPKLLQTFMIFSWLIFYAFFSCLTKNLAYRDHKTQL